MNAANLPDESLAADLATRTLGLCPSTVRRFRTGSTHYVFDLGFEDHPSIVVRIAGPGHGSAMEGAARLSKVLRPLGVPLPAMIADGSRQPIPYLILERLAGTDLGKLIATFDDAALERTAIKIAEAQAETSKVPTSGRYGYAARGDQAPFAAWSDVLHQNLARSRRRIIAAGLFDTQMVEVVSGMVETARMALDSLPATPFLHDTTTRNVIVTDRGDFSGIVDVDDLCFGDPRYVVALTLASLTAFGGPIRYADIWMRISGYADDHIFRLYVALFLVDFMAEHGQTFNGNQRPSKPEDRESLLAHFAAALPRAGA